MIVALSADVDVRIVLVRERVGGGQKEIVCRRQRLPELVGVNDAGHRIRPGMLLVRVVAYNASDADVCVVCHGSRRIQTFDQGET